jgi:uncharacterized protein YoaH (UPF0181 family)
MSKRMVAWFAAGVGLAVVASTIAAVARQLRSTKKAEAQPVETEDVGALPDESG